MNQVRSSSNPQLALQNLLVNNPNFRNIMQLVQNGGNLEQIARTMAQRNNVDIDALIRELQK